jgi:hypothetical protein
MLRAMAGRRRPGDTDGETSRKRTADLLRTLRDLTKQTKMLRATIENAQQQETACALPAPNRRRRR